MELERIFMKEAIMEATESIEYKNGGPFGAVVVKDGKVVGKGHNQVTLNNDPTAHAEIIAIREACKALNTYDLEGCEIYASCEPCPMCLGSIYWANISKLYYAATKEDASKAEFSDAHIYEEFALPKNERKLQSIQMMREDAVKVFEKWNEAENKIPY